MVSARQVVGVKAQADGTGAWGKGDSKELANGNNAEPAASALPLTFRERSKRPGSVS